MKQQPILSHYTISIPPENVFRRYRTGILALNGLIF